MRVYLYKNTIRDCYKDRSADRPIAEATLTLTRAMRDGLVVDNNGDIRINGKRLIPSWVGLEPPSTDVVSNVAPFTNYNPPRPRAYCVTWWTTKNGRDRLADFTQYSYTQEVKA